MILEAYKMVEVREGSFSRSRAKKSIGLIIWKFFFQIYFLTIFKSKKKEEDFINFVGNYGMLKYIQIRVHLVI